MKTPYIGLIALAVHTAAFAVELPDELKHIETIVASERLAVQTMRDFDHLQQGLLDWDGALRRQYLDEGQEELARSKEEDIDHRLFLIEAGWTYLLGHYPNNPRVNNYYGEFLHDYTQRETEALRYWHSSVSVLEDYAPGHNNLGLYYLHAGAIRMGLKHVHKSIEIEPKNPVYLFNITQIYLNYFPDIARWYNMPKKKIYAAAMTYSRDAARYDPNDVELAEDYAVNFYAAENFGVEADWDEALKAWGAVMAMADDPEREYFVTLNKARVLIRLTRWDDAIACLNEARALNPGSEVPGKLLKEAEARRANSAKKKRKRAE